LTNAQQTAWQPSSEFHRPLHAARSHCGSIIITFAFYRSPRVANPGLKLWPLVALPKRQEGLELRKQGELLYRVPLVGLERLVILGLAQVTTQALHQLSAKGIDVWYMTRTGKISFALRSPRSDNVFLRLAQAKCFFDREYTMAFARRIVREKINRQIAFVKEHKFADAFDWRSRVEAMASLQEHLEEQSAMDGIRGIEGSAGRIYFECFGAMLTKLSFSGRSRRPAQDEVNALLNLSYTFLCNECAAALEICGLDTSLGFLHGVVYGRQSLALDFMEIYRADATDRLVVRLVNWGMLNAQSFQSDNQIGFRLTPEGFRTFIEQYEKHMTGDAGWRTRIRADADALRRAILEQKQWEVS